jgi:transcriptional regulator with XRE-family HTH domain
MEKAQKKLKKLSWKKSKWKREADFRLKNRKWLRYSSNIARRVLSAIEDNKDLNQKILASNIGVKPQYISRVVQGQENLTLETIAKLSESLNVELISFPEYKYSSVQNYLPLFFDSADLASTHISFTFQEDLFQPFDFASLNLGILQLAKPREILTGESPNASLQETIQEPNKTA